MSEDLHLANYMAIAVLEQMDLLTPTQKQIDVIESILLNVVMVKSMSFDSKLNSTERCCLYWTAKGKVREEIAELMKLTSSDIDECKQSIMKKLTSNSMEQAVFEGIRFGVLPDDAVANTCLTKSEENAS